MCVVLSTTVTNMFVFVSCDRCDVMRRINEIGLQCIQNADDESVN